MLNLIFVITFFFLFLLLSVTISNLNPKFINIIICIMINFSQPKNDLIFNELILKFCSKNTRKEYITQYYLLLDV